MRKGFFYGCFVLLALVVAFGFWGAFGPAMPTLVYAQTGGCPSTTEAANGFNTTDPVTGGINKPVCVDRATGRYVLQALNVVFEGATDDAFETTLGVTDPTADRTITFPDASGTVAVQQGTTITLTNVDLDTTDNSVAANVCEAQVVTATGVAATDNILLTMTTTDLSLVFTVDNPVPGANQLTVRVCNNSAGAVDPGAVADFKVVRLP